MKRYRIRIHHLLLAMLLTSPALLPGVSFGATPDSSAARELIGEYANALKSGDVNALKSILGGELRTSRESLLENPEYPTHLIDTFGNCVFDIVDLTRTESGTFEVVVAIRYSSNETVRRRFVLATVPNDTGRPLQIVSERNFNDD
ncbi:MAG TPA: hypothetical protein VIZ30_04330 [Pseudomonadales bacterium]